MRNLSFIFFSLCTSVLGAQANYFQQAVNYDIEVTLDDQAHTLTGNISIHYTNHSPDTLTFLYFHLWPNAYKDKSTAFARQNLQQGNDNFYFATPQQLGGISGLAFQSEGQSLQMESQKDFPDIAKIALVQPLLPGRSMTISTPFRVDIPTNFSRLGHSGNAYQLTQWYPKPAVYDQDGWHPMPYLELGEYYSEFGSYEVDITLPGNYVVGATGTLQTTSEYEYLAQRAIATQELIQTGFADTLGFPPSSSEWKTLRYTAEKVHDFAWFADKRFHVLNGETSLPGGRKVKTWAFFTNLEADIWTSAPDYLSRAIQFYSETVGEYPYPQVTAVEGPLFAGGAMEYPMITVVAEVGTAQALDRFITHEVGHNWFYGILASNERDHPWMDEGLNSYYENRYMNRFYPDANADMLPPAIERFAGNGTSIDINQQAYLYMARRHLDQAPQTLSIDLSPINYFVSAYLKPALALRMLEHYLGRENFDRVMQQYFRTWQFRHPQPRDLKAVLENESREDLNWLFDGLLYSSRQMDYALVSVGLTDGQIKLQIKNKGSIDAPFPVSALKNGQIVASRWYPGFHGNQQLDFPAGEYDVIRIDAERITLEVNRKNNSYRPGRVLPKVEPFNLKFALGVENPDRTTVYWLPLIAGNKYDGVLLGAAFYNNVFPAQKFEYLLAPLLATRPGEWAGLADINYHIYPASRALQRVSLGLSWKRFQYNYNEPNDYFLGYQRLVPSVRLRLGKKPTGNLQQEIRLRSILLSEDLANFDSTGNFSDIQAENSLIHELSYTLEKISPVNPYRFRLMLEQQSYERKILSTVFNERYLKASAELKTSYTYKSGKNISVRIFAGYFLQNSRRGAGNVATRGTRAGLALTSQGFNDYLYDDYFLGRSENTGLFSRQIVIREGGMKNALGSSFKTGISNDFILALNLKADLPQDLPLRLPLRPYFDIGYFRNAQPTGQNDSFRDQVLWSGGVMLEIGQGLFREAVLAIYFPIVHSDNLKMQYDSRDGGKYFSRISFSMNLKAANPWKLIDEFGF